MLGGCIRVEDPDIMSSQPVGNNACKGTRDRRKRAGRTSDRSKEEMKEKIVVKMNEGRVVSFR